MINAVPRGTRPSCVRDTEVAFCGCRYHLTTCVYAWNWVSAQWARFFFCYRCGASHCELVSPACKVSVQTVAKINRHKHQTMRTHTQFTSAHNDDSCVMILFRIVCVCTTCIHGPNVCTHSALPAKDNRSHPPRVAISVLARCWMRPYIIRFTINKHICWWWSQLINEWICWSIFGYQFWLINWTNITLFTTKIKCQSNVFPSNKSNKRCIHVCCHPYFRVWRASSTFLILSANFS